MKNSGNAEVESTRPADVRWTVCDTDITSISDDVEALTGFAPDYFRNGGTLAWASRVHPLEFETAASEWLLADEENRLASIEIRFKKADGSYVWLWQRVVARRIENGKRVLECVSSDISDWREPLEQRMQERQRQLVARVAGGIAHSVNNLLGTILANVQFVAEELSPVDPRRSDADEIRASAERAGEIMARLLALSQQTTLEPRATRLDAVLTAVEPRLRTLCGNAVSLRIVSAPAPIPLFVDARRIAEALFCLAVNACEAMPDGGTLTISEGTAELDAAIAHELRIARGRYALLRIRDTGIGMDTETRERALEPFFSTKARGQALGLGLTASDGVIRQSGGAVKIESERGLGTEIAIYLPLASAVESSKSISEGGPSRTTTVLIVEDDDGVRRACTRILRNRGYVPLAASSADEALALARQHQHEIRLLLSDVVMPDRSGMEVAAMVRELCPTVRILFMSGYSDRELTVEGVSPREIHFLPKPFSPDTLHEKVRAALGE